MVGEYQLQTPDCVLLGSVFGVLKFVCGPTFLGRSCMYMWYVVCEHTPGHVKTVVTFPRRSSIIMSKGQMLSHLGNICWMLPLATHCHTHYHLYPFHFMLFKFKDLVAKQHSTNTVTCVTCTQCCSSLLQGQVRTEPCSQGSPTSF